MAWQKGANWLFWHGISHVRIIWNDLAIFLNEKESIIYEKSLNSSYWWHFAMVLGSSQAAAKQQTTHLLDNLLQRIPEISSLAAVDLKVVCNIDSSDANIEIWNLLAAIHDNWDDFDGFVVVHGTDTMAWTATALSHLFWKV